MSKISELKEAHDIYRKVRGFEEIQKLISEMLTKPSLFDFRKFESSPPRFNGDKGSIGSVTFRVSAFERLESLTRDEP